ncbi:amidohydrolase family protein [Tomitella fengzijianii]|uniref:Amidohydrolase family protein n=2 Tax=Tomitella fengzijianii TaxID=2597660 RepID=A0A516X7Y7_9ACTN|nr:amidohydrolase family protein [Tomitella fengzijianii]
MAVVDGTVAWLGDDDPAHALHPDARVIDLQGAFVAPAFVDPHVHVTDTGLSLTGLNLSGAASLADCLDALGTYARRHPETRIIWGHGWDETRWPERRAPSADDLEGVAPGRDVYLSRIDEHSAAASRGLIASAGLPAPAQGAPAQPLHGDEHHAVRTRARLLLDPAQLDHARRAALDHAAAHGIVAVHECGGPDIAGADDFRAVLAMGAGEHSVAVRGYWGEPVTTARQARSLLAEHGAHALGGDLFLDGALGSRTAWLHEPYADHSGNGTAHLDGAAAAAHLRACTEAGIQAGFHAIGDAAVHAATGAFAAAAEAMGGPAVAGRAHRIEHAELVSREQAAVLGRLGAVASVQPVFDALWGGPHGMYADRLGAARTAQTNPFSVLAAEGVTLAIGSDSPVTAMDPWAAVRAAVNHSVDDHSLSPRAAFTAATRGAWRAAGLRDGMAGTLQPGAEASFAVWETGELVVAASSKSIARWSTDPRSRVPALPDMSADAPAPRCLATVRSGRMIYTAA